MNQLVNCNVIIKVNLANDIVSNKIKGHATNEDTLFELSIPLSTVFVSIGSNYYISSSLNDLTSNSLLHTTITNTNIVLNNSFVQLDIISDNDLGEYLNGSSIMKYNSITYNNVSTPWTLHYKEEPFKGKVKPTLDELKSKHIENVNKLISNQEKLVKYSINIQSNQIFKDIIPSFKSDNGKVYFDNNLALTIDSNENIKEMPALWSVKFPSLPNIFLHRKQLKQLLTHLKEEQSIDHFLSITLSRVSLPDGLALEGPPLTIEGKLDLAGLLQPNTTTIDLPIQSEHTIVINFSISKPLVKDLKIINNNQVNIDNIPKKEILNYNNNKDIINELNNEILNCIKIIANEYISLYPVNDSSNADLSITLNNDRKLEFFNYLSNNGILHNIKELLKPKLYEVIYYYYGIRGQTLLYSKYIDKMSYVNSSRDGNSDNKDNIDLDEILNELYILLVKHCNIVLNTLYNETLIKSYHNIYDQKNTSLNINNNKYVDENESISETINRLLLLAKDYEYNSNFNQSEEIYLQLIQLTSNTNSYIYFHYGIFCLKQSSTCADKILASNYLNKSRDIIKKSLDLHKQDNLLTNYIEVSYIYSCILIEFQQYIQAEEILISLQQSNNSISLLDKLDSLDGYETDDMINNINDPMYYCILASYFSLINKPLHARKAMLLVTRAFIESNSKPDITTHGKPKRTLVYCLSMTSQFFYQYNFIQLLNQSIKLMNLSEEAINNKCKVRNITTSTITFIKYQMKKALCQHAISSKLLVQLFKYPSDDKLEDLDDNKIDNDRLNQAIDCATDCIFTATIKEEQIDAYILLAKVQTIQQLDSSIIIDSYLSAVSISNQSNDSLLTYINIEVYIQLSKLLLISNRYEEGYNILLIVIKSYPITSSILLYLSVFCLRLHKLIECEDCIIQANIIDSNNNEIWAYYSLLCLTIGINRYNDSIIALKQVIRLKYENITILREIAMSYILYNKYSVAEDIIRYCMNLEIKLANRVNILTRKILGDILVNQNQLVQAINEYQLILNDTNYDSNNKAIVLDKINIGKKCIECLQSLGRYEEINIVNNIVDNLKQVTSSLE